MKFSSFAVISLALLLTISCKTSSKKENQRQNVATQLTQNEKMDWAIIVHGGAGAFGNGTMPKDDEQKWKEHIAKSRKIGETILKQGGSSLEAVVKTIQSLENDPLFNAGKGAVLTDIGTAELDASIMNGKDLNAGAVAGVRTVKNPILLAQEVMLHSPHVFLSNDGAEQFAKQQKLELVNNDYFITEKRKTQYQAKKQASLNNKKMGTVGCVALDKQGNIVAATSTGGTFLKKWGRIGDSPIIGAGTYADNNTCGISATGWGEYFIRGTVARDVAALMEYKGLSIDEAAQETIHKKLPKIDSVKAKGGVIGLDQSGNITAQFNTYGMIYSYSKSNGDEKISIFQ